MPRSWAAMRRTTRPSSTRANQDRRRRRVVLGRKVRPVRVERGGRQGRGMTRKDAHGLPRLEVPEAQDPAGAAGGCQAPAGMDGREPARRRCAGREHAGRVRRRRPLLDRPRRRTWSRCGSGLDGRRAWTPRGRGFAARIVARPSARPRRASSRDARASPASRRRPIDVEHLDVVRQDGVQGAVGGAESTRTAPSKATPATRPSPTNVTPRLLRALTTLRPAHLETLRIEDGDGNHRAGRPRPSARRR